ncbi:tripartite tricarboxylate transporter permease [Rhodococcus sp. IEGM 1330]|uniref:tripartite tricarboxylate transporter permease n=1 Tax=Rhodococcus sp. IEGM 1330 TaxID=3082225 RepID=UPI002954BEF1|nr:tripartite tricarboxylate transporter permease [Rhodococcus sp. IEGM 1330]MDV8025227.1 tripartite tricarboxylate transporter permease [Rhodococcus sp. IEGM 1330]
MGFPDLMAGFINVLTPTHLLFALLGCVLGMLVGVLPGFGPAAAVSLLIPITFGLDATTALIMLAAILYGAAFGGTVTAVLLRIPGEASSIATTLDGYEMAKSGRGGPALVVAALASFVGGLVGVVGFVVVAPFSRFALEFGAPELFLVALLGMALITSFSGNNPAKALISVGLGLAIASVGIDSGQGIQRFTFGMPELFDGVALVAVVMGCFGLTEILIQARSAGGAGRRPLAVGKLLPTKADITRSAGPTMRGSVIGFFMGLLPGSPGAATSLASYAMEKKLTKRPGQFGKGAVEGVAGPESANNALALSSMIPLFTLGIPTSATVAIMASAFTINGLIPGPLLFRDNPEVAWTIIASFLVGNIILLILNVPLVRLWIAVLKIPFHYLMAMILAFMFLGVYSINGSVFDIFIMLGAGVIGYLFHLTKIPLTPLVLALILGPLLEENFQRSLSLSRGDYGVFVEGPINKVLLLVFIAAVLFGMLRPVLARILSRRATRTQPIKEPVS